MPRDDLLYLDDMLNMARKVEVFLKGKTKESFDQDEVLQLATTHALQVIGEASWKVSPEFKDAHPEVPWKQIAGFRHRAVHDYFDVRLDIVWSIAVTELGPLIAQLEPLIPRELPPDVPF